MLGLGSMPTTWQNKSEADVPKVAVLVPVLDYEDLTASDSGACLVLGDEKEILFARTETGALVYDGSGTISVPDRWVSSRHAQMRLLGEDPLGPRRMLSDLGSRNGTCVNGEPIDAEVRLIDGDVLEVGHRLFCYRIVDVDLAERLRSPGAAFSIGPTTTRCPAVAALTDDISQIAPSELPILVLGETGSGKEILAKAVHDASGRTGAFVAVDCGAVPESLFEATFFGHRRGAFTGALEHRTGEILRADGGTLFLDEVANMSLACQAKLLRVIEEGLVTAVGATDSARVDVRWIAATNSTNLGDASAFRPDLLQRLSGYIAKLPPLRRRRDDLGVLAAHALSEAGIERASISAEAARRLFAHPLPGNIRQLRNVLCGAAMLARDRSIEPRDIEHLEATPDEAPGEVEPSQKPREVPGAKSSSRPEVDAALLESTLESTGGNVLAAARILGRQPRQIYRLMERFQISLERFRAS